MKAWVPAGLLFLFAAWCGTFQGGVGATASFVAYASLLALAPTNRRWWDPLALGRAAGVFTLALLSLVCVSLWLSPVARAGRTAVVLLPAFLLLPGALAAAWRSEGARRRGLRTLSAVVLVVSCWALADRFLAGTPRAAMPLGHHNLLAVWLVTVLPLAVLGARYGNGARWLAAAAALSGTAALVATGSLAGTAALALEVSAAVVLLGSSSRKRGWLLGGGLFLALACLPLLPRLADLWSGRDASWAARRAYLQAGMEGIGARPGAGWGPGSTPWVVSEFLQPLPAVHPPGELVGDLHSLPLQLVFELGAPATVLCFLLFALILRRPSTDDRDAALGAAAKLGCLGFGVASLGGAPLSVLALPVALATALGAGLAAAPPARDWEDRSSARSPWRWVPVAYGAAAAVLLTPSLVAHHAFEAAAEEEDPLPAVARAVRWDPRFPLYRARYSALSAQAPEALAAAEDGWGVGAFWLLAASLGGQAREPWSEAAALRACRLDPFGALPPFILGARLEDPPGPVRDAAGAVARSLLAEPRLLAAPEIYLDGPLRRRAVDRIRRQGGVDEGWRARWVELDRELGGDASPEPGAPPPAMAKLSQGFDGRPELALSTFLFRRRPWPLTLVTVELNAQRVSRIDLPPATRLRDTAAWVFSRESCDPGEPGGGAPRSH